LQELDFLVSGALEFCDKQLIVSYMMPARQSLMQVLLRPILFQDDAPNRFFVQDEEHELLNSQGN